MRLAGTAIQYSTSAIAQLAITAAHIGALGNLRWPYQAVVMKTLLPINRRIGSTAGDRNDICRVDSAALGDRGNAAIHPEVATVARGSSTSSTASAHRSR